MPPMSKIDSVQNSMVKHAYSLKTPKGVKEAEDFLCEGFHLVQEALKSGVRCRFIFGTAQAWKSGEGQGILAAAQREKTKCFEVPTKIIAYVSDTVAPQGIVAVAAKVEPRWPAEPFGPILALYRLQDAGNLGTIFRSAEAFGFQGILLTEGCCDPFNPKVVRSSMGSLMRVPFVQGGTWEECQAWFQEKKIRTFALSLEGGEAIQKVRLAPPFAFWIGAEGAGLPTELTDRCDGRIFIPMSGKVESLNAAIAASLAMFWAGSGGPVS